MKLYELRYMTCYLCKPVIILEINMNKLIALVAILFASLSSFSQTEIDPCGHSKATNELLEKYPNLFDEISEAEVELELFTQQFEQQRAGDDEILIVPVVFHIIHNYGPENIDDAQVHSAIEYTNIYFRLLNENYNDVIEEFIGLAADVQIEFRLAQLDPNGNCTSGITRTVSDLTYQGDSEMKSLIQWPRDQYLNIWVCSYANGSAGYSLYPSSVDSWFAAGEDGIVLRHDYVGAIGTSSFGQSSTLSHEIGHWLNLRHLWGNSNEPGLEENCDMDDLVNDTPKTIGWTSCSLNGESCGTHDHVQNYMSYSNCRRIFTHGQRTRMRAALNSSTADRNELSQESNLIATGTFDLQPMLCTANFSIDNPVVCIDQEVQFHDLSYNGVENWSWDFGDGEVLEGNDPDVHKNPVHYYSEEGTYSVTLVVSNASGEMAEEQLAAITILPASVQELPLVDGFENGLLNDTWYLINQDNNQQWHIQSSTSYTGSKALKLDNFNNDLDGNLDAIVSSTMDVSEAQEVTISYRWSYINTYPETDDRLKIYISPDCGTTWVLKKMHRGSTDLPCGNPSVFSWEPNDASDWKYYAINIDNVTQFSDTWRVKFEFEGKGGNNIYLDDINIIVDGVVGTEELNPTAAITLFPNPAEGNVSLNISSNQAGRGTISVVNVTGQLVDEIHSGDLGQLDRTFQLSVANWPSGIYFVVIQGERLKRTAKLVVY